MKATVALNVIDAIETHFKNTHGITGGFKLDNHSHYELSKGAWSITMEGFDGDIPWTYLASENVKIAGVFLEPINHYALGVYDA